MAYIGQSLTEGTRRVYTYVATASQTTFNAVYGVGAVDVYQNGVLLQPSDYTATDGTSVVLDTGAALDDEITIICHNTFSVADTVSASQGGTFNNDISVSGDLTVDTNTLYVDSTNNRVGVGTASPQLPLDVVGQIRATDGSCQVRMIPIDASNAAVVGTYSNDALVLNTNSTERIRILSTGGITFNGDTAQANALDDYEEGTWSPFWCNTSGQAIFDTAPTTANGRYTKIGDTVHATCFMTMPSVFYATAAYSATASLNIGGLPFAANRSGGSDYNAGTVGWYNAFNGHAAGYAPMCYAESGTTRVILVYAAGAYPSSFVQSVALYAASGIMFSVSYKTTA